VTHRKLPPAIVLALRWLAPVRRRARSTARPSTTVRRTRPLLHFFVAAKPVRWALPPQLSLRFPSSFPPVSPQFAYALPALSSARSPPTSRAALDCSQSAKNSPRSLSPFCLGWPNSARPTSARPNCQQPNVTGPSTALRPLLPPSEGREAPPRRPRVTDQARRQVRRSAGLAPPGWPPGRQSNARLPLGCCSRPAKAARVCSSSLERAANRQPAASSQQPAASRQ